MQRRQPNQPFYCVNTTTGVGTGSTYVGRNVHRYSSYMPLHILGSLTISLCVSISSPSNPFLLTGDMISLASSHNALLLHSSDRCITSPDNEVFSLSSHGVHTIVPITAIHDDSDREQYTHTTTESDQHDNLPMPCGTDKRSIENDVIIWYICAQINNCNQ